MKLGRKAGTSQRAQRNIMYACVSVSLSVVLATLGVYFFGQALYRPDLVAENRFKHIAREYYEEYLYPTIVKENTYGDGTVDLADAFKKYKNNGFPTVKLRNLLLYKDQPSNTRDYFQNNRYYCDTNTSVVSFRPKEPFGKTDYEMRYYLNCVIVE
jgi:hypothetical protein